MTWNNNLFTKYGNIKLNCVIFYTDLCPRQDNISTQNNYSARLAVINLHFRSTK